MQKTAYEMCISDCSSDVCSSDLFTVEFVVDTGHDFQQRGLTRAVEAQHADLGAGEERERNVFQDFAIRRNNFAQPMHGVDVIACFARSDARRVGTECVRTCCYRWPLYN